MWVFIGGKLTVDIGGIHGQAEESVTIRDNGTLFVDTCDQTGTANGNMCAVKADYTVPDITLESGKIYEIAVFQAERHVTGSNYQLTLQGFSLDTSVCSPQCGVDPPVVTPGEECDDGTKNGTGYGKCSTHLHVERLLRRRRTQPASGGVRQRQQQRLLRLRRGVLRPGLREASLLRRHLDQRAVRRVRSRRRQHQ